MWIVKKSWVFLLKKLEIGSSLSTRLVKLTGKSSYYLHPKHLIQVEAPWFLKYLRENNLVLDLGCGCGWQTLKVAKITKEIIGIDKDERQLEIAKSEAKKRKLNNVFFQKGDLEGKFPNFRNNQFDVILLLDVLEHLQNRDQITDEIRRILKPKGMFLLSVPNKNTSWKKLQRSVGLNSFADSDHKIEYSRKEIVDFLEKHNFKIFKIEPVVYDTPLSAIIDFVGGISLPLYKKLQVWKRNYVLKHPSESTGFHLASRKSL